MKFKTALIIASFLSIFIFPACQKAQEQPKPKPVASQAKQIPQPQQTQPVKEASLQKAKFRQFTSTEKTTPLTESEQKYFDEIGGYLERPDKQLAGKNVLKYLQILVKGSPKTIRFYQENNVGMTEKQINNAYGEAIGDAFARLNPKDPRVENLAKQILRTRRNYTNAVGYAINALGYSGDKSVISLLRKFLNYPNELIEADAAGALLKLGDADTALPVIKKLGAVSYLVDGTGKLYDKRGKDVLVDALSDRRAEVAMVSAMLLYKMGIEKNKCEEAALNVVKRLIHKKNTDYGFEVIGGPSNPEWVLLPGFKNRNLQDIEKPFYSDRRGCYDAIFLLGKFKTKQAIPLLEYMKNKIGNNSDYVCWENLAGKDAEHALNEILDKRGAK